MIAESELPKLHALLRKGGAPDAPVRDERTQIIERSAPDYE